LHVSAALGTAIYQQIDDSWKQVRSKLSDLPSLLHEYFRNKLNFEDLGQLIER